MAAWSPAESPIYVGAFLFQQPDEWAWAAVRREVSKIPQVPGFDTKRLEECFSQSLMKLLRKHSQASFTNSPNKLNQFYRRAWLGEHVAWELGFHRFSNFERER